VCWSIVLKERPTAGSPFWGAFPSHCIPKASKDVNVHFFNHRSYSCKLYWRNPVIILGNSSKLHWRIPVNYIREFQ
jgi:hypothetical protein